MSDAVRAFAVSPRVFISYARSDGAEFATSLHEKLGLTCPDVTLWLDRAEMFGGVGWWRQITEALDRVEILIMVLTPGALRSDVAAKEWRYARQQGVRICPVMESDGIFEFSSMPSWMRRIHCYDLHREWDSFVGYLRSAGREVRVPFMAPELTDHHVERHDVFDSVLSQVFDATRDEPRRVNAALHGPGGFGKTTMATKLCLDERVISAFDDGVLWVRLGESPNIRGELTKLYGALTGERPPFVDIDDASFQLTEKLGQKCCLLVIDDVWELNHLKPFMRGGRQCSRLVTTRQMSIALEVAGANRTLVDRMTPAEAQQMLSARLALSCGKTDALRSLADRLGEWPLLLKLAGSQLAARVQRGDSLDGAIAFANRALEKRGVLAFDRTTPADKDGAIASTVEASLELFSNEDRDHCAALSVLHGDFPFPLATAAALWDLDEFDTEDLLMRLADTALIEFDLKTGLVRLHHVIRAYLSSRLDDKGALSSALTTAWLSDPYNLPDIYAWTWVGWHLAQAGHQDRLRQLLFDFHWLGTLVATVPLESVLADLDLLQDSEDACRLRDALRLASTGLTFDPGQLSNQLNGRICRGLSTDIDRLLDEATSMQHSPQLGLVGTSLTHPGGALTGIWKSHTGTVTALAISPNSCLAISASEDWTMRLWDLRDDRVMRNFQGHTGAVHTVAFSPDGQTLLSGSEDQSLRLWDVASGNEIGRLTGHTLGVRGVAIAATGTHAASAAEDGSVRAWNLPEKETRLLYKGPYHQLGPLVFSTDGQELIFAAGDWTIRIIPFEDAGRDHVLTGHCSLVRALALTPDGNRLVSGGDDGTIIVWSLRDLEPLFELDGHSDSVDSLAVSSDGQYLISGARDRTLRVWELNSGVHMRTLNGHSGAVKAVAVSSNTLILSGSTDRSIRRWSLDSEETEQHSIGHTESIAFLSMSLDGAGLVSGTRNGELRVWKMHADSLSDPALESSRNSVAFLDNGGLEGHNGPVYALQITSDGRFVIAGMQGGKIMAWDTTDGTYLHVMECRIDRIRDLHCSADGTRMVSLGSDRTIRTWDMKTGRMTRALVSSDNSRSLNALRVHDPMLAELEAGPKVDISKTQIPRDPTIALSPDGNKVIVASPGNICVWDLRDGSTRDRQHDAFDIVMITFNESSEIAVMGSMFGPLVVWDFEAEPSVLLGHGARIVDILVSSSDNCATSAGADGSIWTWDLTEMIGRTSTTIPIDEVDVVAIVANGAIAYSICGDTLVAYDIHASSRFASLSFDHYVTNLAVTPSGSRIAVGDESGRVHTLCLQSSVRP